MFLYCLCRLLSFMEKKNPFFSHFSFFSTAQRNYYSHIRNYFRRRKKKNLQIVKKNVCFQICMYVFVNGYVEMYGGVHMIYEKRK